MKHVLIILICFGCSFQNLGAQALEVGAAVPAFQLTLLNGDTESFTEKDLKGQVTILEFWATYCSPCIPSMEKLADLQDDFGGEVQVIAISHELPERIRRFIENKKMDLRFADDATKAIRSFFPHQTIPHTVLIDPAGKVAAITRPGEVTSEVIAALLAGSSVQLSLKEDNNEFDYQADYFQMDTNTLASFIIESAIPNVGTFSKAPNQGPFAGRRISMHNFTIDGLYRLAYQTSSYRLVYEVDESLFDYGQEQNKYCVDIIVAPEEKDQLYQALLRQLDKQFDIKARLERRTVEVIAMYQPDTLSIHLPEAIASIPFSAGGDHFTSAGATFSDFADYLEGFGIIGMPVVDATGNKNLFHIDFGFEPENPETFHQAIRQMGLKLKKEKREIEVLVIYQVPEK